jgi:hypothetical protein
MDDEQIRKEDEELIRRLSETPARYTFKIDVGPQTSEDVDRYLRDVRKKFNGPFENPLDNEDDFFPKN